MANENNKSFMDTMVEAQKQLVNSALENTRKLTNGNTIVNETMEKGSEWYKNWLDNQKHVFGQTADKATSAAGNMQDQAGKMNEFYQNWFSTQLNWARQVWDMNVNQLKQLQQQTTASNPMDQMTGAWNSWMNNMGNFSNWMNGFSQFQQMNPFNMNSWKSAADNAGNIFNQWSELLSSNFSEFQKNLQNGTIQDAYRNMVNTTDGFTRFYELWSPMWKSIQEKTFSMDQYKQFMNPAMYKEFMDKFFSFMPESSRNYMQQWTSMLQQGFQQMGQSGMGGYQQLRGMMNGMPGMNGADFFSNLLNGYNSFYSTMNQAASPIVRMMTPNQQTKNMAEWQDIANRYMVYSIKNAELQYMVYQQGTKVMDAVAEHIAAKMQQGEEVKSMMALYQEWLNISDKTFVSLFESPEYSQLMAEVSALQLKLRKDVELQLEKMMVNIPVATRSEMDELYKTIYDLKKEVRQLEKMLEIDEEPSATEQSAAEQSAAEQSAAPKANGRAKKA